MWRWGYALRDVLLDDFVTVWTSQSVVTHTWVAQAVGTARCSEAVSLCGLPQNNTLHQAEENIVRLRDAEATSYVKVLRV